jgi:hypothetical protein
MLAAQTEALKRLAEASCSAVDDDLAAELADTHQLLRQTSVRLVVLEKKFRGLLSENEALTAEVRELRRLVASAPALHSSPFKLQSSTVPDALPICTRQRRSPLEKWGCTLGLGVGIAVCAAAAFSWIEWQALAPMTYAQLVSAAASHWKIGAALIERVLK